MENNKNPTKLIVFIVDGFVHETKRLSLLDKTAFSGRENGFLYGRKRLFLAFYALTREM